MINNRVQELFRYNSAYYTKDSNIIKRFLDICNKEGITVKEYASLNDVTTSPPLNGEYVIVYNTYQILSGANCGNLFAPSLKEGTKYVFLLDGKINDWLRRFEWNEFAFKKLVKLDPILGEKIDKEGKIFRHINLFKYTILFNSKYTLPIVFFICISIFFYCYFQPDSSTEKKMLEIIGIIGTAITFTLFSKNLLWKKY